MEMTREEKEQTGKYVLQMARLLEDGCYQQEMLLKAVHIIDETLEQEPTTKNNSPHCQHTDEEIAKSFIEDVEAVKDQLPCGEQMDFPNTFDEFAKDYSFRDKKEIYTNGSELIPVFRVKQWLEHISTTKNNLGVDCISRQEVLRLLANSIGKTNTYLQTKVLRMPSVTPQLSSELEKNSKKLEKDFGELDCISRADVKAKKIYSHERHEYVVPVAEIDWLPSVTPEITLEDVKGYCKPRLLTLITNELYHELIHHKIKPIEQEPCDKCEVGNQCLYCKHEFEPQESEDNNGKESK